MRRLLLVCCLAAGAASCAAEPPPPVIFPDGEMIDLTHAYDQTTIFWPTSEPFRLETVADGVTPEGYYYAANNLSSAEHGGTHLDAPVHFGEGKPTVDRIPISRFVGHAVVVDVMTEAEDDPDYQVSVDDFERAERTLGPIAADDIVLIRTGFSQRWPDAARYLGTAARGAEAARHLHFPGLHPDAARWLVENRPVKAIGIDTASIDYGPSTLFESHRILSDAGIPVFENLAALERLPLRGALVMALPMKIGGGSGAPLRAVAMLPGT